MISNKFISIALCTYNGEKFLSEQIESILLQTHKNFELIIVDDCSHDKTIDIVKEYMKKYKNIKLFENCANLGFVKNFEKAIELCSGEYIFLSDQDDIWDINKISYFLNNINENSSLIYSNALIIDSKQKNINNRTLLNEADIITNKNNLFFLFNNSVSGNTMMFRKKLKKFILPFPEDINFHDIWIGFVASSLNCIQYTEKNLIMYRQHSSNVTDINKTTKKEKISKKEKSFKLKTALLKNYYIFLEQNAIQHENLPILKQLHKEYSNYKKFYFNFKLLKLFLQNKNKIFVTKKQKRISFIIKNCFGIKAYKLFPFL
jgi:glycosyltransferase involved in cell wall biosynthesis